MDDNTCYEVGLIDAYKYIKCISYLPSEIRRTMFNNADSIEKVLNDYDIYDIVGKIKEYTRWQIKEEKESQK